MNRPAPLLITATLLAASLLSLAHGQDGSVEDEDVRLNRTFKATVVPFLETHCLDCHGADDPKAKFDLSVYPSAKAVRQDIGHWDLVLDRLVKREMPPETELPDEERRAVIDWFTRLRKREANRNAGDPGEVLSRRLSNAEYDYTIHDLTGADIRPTREFPVDPANSAGFTNSGESLAMSPALLKKYLVAAQHVANHLVLTPTGIDFAPHPVVTVTDRDKYCVHRIIEFYRRQPVDLADYFYSAARLRESKNAESSLDSFAAEDQVSPKYLRTLWDLLTRTTPDADPLRELRQRFRALPRTDKGDLRKACGALRDWVHKQRGSLAIELDLTAIDQLKPKLQPRIVWYNQKIAANRRHGQLPTADGNPETDVKIAAIREFCSIFPDQFLVSERGRAFLDPSQQNKGRYLSAGFHLMVGYFRDDRPLYDLILDESEQAELDSLWRELNFVTQAPLRQFRDFVYFERAESTRYFTYPEFDFARPEDNDITSPEKMKRIARLFVARAERNEIPPAGLKVLEDYFVQITSQVRSVESELAAAEPQHLWAVLTFAQRAWRRPLTPHESDEIRQFYRTLREADQLSHEAAMRDLITMILVSPKFSYLAPTPPPGDNIQPLSDIELANRLSYFLWSSMPDDQLQAAAASGRLRDPDVLKQQTRRLLSDPKSRRLAIEFGGHWLGFRQFLQHSGVDRTRFTTFDEALRDAMLEEPVRWLTDLLQRNGSVLEMLNARHTFVNRKLAEHYDIPVKDLPEDEWTRVDDADRYGRGGLLPMAVFLTKNSPGLRTSPVKRGFWVVRQLLGEHIPAPPADVPELPEDEAELGELSLREVLQRHRAVESCAGCHRKFDSIGMAFEGFGPIGERRRKDLGGRPIDDAASFPDGRVRRGIDGLRHYLQSEREAEFIDQFCRKLLAFALGRSLQLSDEATIERMRNVLRNDDYRVHGVFEAIVTSPQFLNRRGRDFDPNSRP